MAFLDPVTLQGERVVLEPMTLEVVDELAAAVRDGELWRLWYAAVPAPDQMRAAVEDLLAKQSAGAVLPFVQRRRDTGEVVGQTTYLNADRPNRRLEIGSTWLARSTQGTGINAEAKYLLLGNAFEAWDCIAVELRTHWMNEQSRAAIARLGAKQDGVLRSHRIMPDGSLRDTVVFSVLQHEWPAVRNGLLARLSR
ncbi:RimJ/RimL family protein N-acetyltransferase [Motilibacter rhizosphaerae]|uniref:RimJ/RimL family protein N-acetyltransferase n=1 Tax=Motilibacter rhizosphaerae TaxID=598652 RepID=A0A4Q7NUZ4_9ACTN|nr:GNAT family protein [Motilibacter rhizosphaerae]RZS91043.1 RimJ/RimL family protein N-acetyltransferase [Motilibacter rhizosphaerae]